MSNGNYCLRSNSFEANIQTTWQQLQNGGEFCDVTLACDDKLVQAHKIIISASSPVLRNILNSNSNLHLFIYLRGIIYEDLINLVTFMYQGKVNVVEQDLQRFLATAEDLQVKGLSEQNEKPLHPISYIKDGDGFDSVQNRGQIIDAQYPHIPKILHTESEELEDDSNIATEKSMHKVDEQQGKSEKLKQRKVVTKRKSAVLLNKNTRVACLQCDKSFLSKKYLRRHIASTHEGIRYPCKKCDYKATQTGSLRAHVNAVHEGIRYSSTQVKRLSEQNEKPLHPISYNKDADSFDSFRNRGQIIDTEYPNIPNSLKTERVEKEDDSSITTEKSMHKVDTNQVKSEKLKQKKVVTKRKSAEQNEKPLHPISYNKDADSFDSFRNRGQIIDTEYPNVPNSLKTERVDKEDDSSITTEKSMHKVDTHQVKSEKLKQRKVVTKRKSAVLLNKNTRVPCQQCQKSFLSKKHLRRHIASTHEGVRYPCKKCDYKATQTGSLRAHVNSVHEGIRYSCSQCEFTATVKPFVNRHMKKFH